MTGKNQLRCIEAFSDSQSEWDRILLKVSRMTTHRRMEWPCRWISSNQVTSFRLAVSALVSGSMVLATVAPGGEAADDSWGVLLFTALTAYAVLLEPFWGQVFLGHDNDLLV